MQATPSQPQEPVETPEIAELPEFDEDADYVSTPGIETDLVYPKEFTSVPRPSEIVDPDYTPAETAEGLEEVGGIQGWWDNPDHWGSSKQYVGFGPQDKVVDPAVIEVLAKQAIVEALAVQRYAENNMESASAPLNLVPGKEALLEVASVEIVAGPDGSVALKNEADYERVWQLLSSGEAAEPVPSAPELSSEQAIDLLKSWGGSWKGIQLADPVVKFYAVKRIQRLTGHIVPDGKLLGFQSINSLIAHIARPPKARKLAEEIQMQGLLAGLPNVQVSATRVGPIDKEKAVGRWKIITRELEKRSLPVTGTGGYAKDMEKKWNKLHMHKK